MLYTITPLERIYNNQVNSLINSRYPIKELPGEKGTVPMMANNTETERKIIEIPHGNIYAKKQGEYYVIDNICSTDPKDYLSDKYLIGTII